MYKHGRWPITRPRAPPSFTTGVATTSAWTRLNGSTCSARDAIVAMVASSFIRRCRKPEYGKQETLRNHPWQRAAYGSPVAQPLGGGYPQSPGQEEPGRRPGRFARVASGLSGVRE